MKSESSNAANGSEPVPSNDAIRRETVTIKPPKTEPISTVEQAQVTDEAEAKKPSTDEPVRAEESDVQAGGAIKLGKRKAGERAIASEFLECMAKAKRQSAESDASSAAKDQAFDKEPKPKKERRYLNNFI